MVSLFWKSRIFWFSTGLDVGKESRRRFESPSSVQTEKLFLQHDIPCARMSFAFICTTPHTHTAERRPERANPAPTKGSVTFLNEEINLSRHPLSPSHPLFCLYGNLFEKRWRNNLWFHPTRFLRLNLIYKSLSLSSHISPPSAAVLTLNHCRRMAEAANAELPSQHILCLLKNCLSLFSWISAEKRNVRLSPFRFISNLSYSSRMRTLQK